MATIGNALAGGIDVQGAVSSIINGLRGPERLLQTQQSLLNSQQSVLNDVSAKLSSLLTKVDALRSGTGALNAKTTTSANSAVVTAAAGAAAQAGTHTIVVASVATTASIYSSQLATSSTTFSAGNIAIKIGGNNPVTIPVDGTNNTLDGLAASINNAAAGVSASVVTDSGGARLALVAKSSGAAGDVTITSNASGLTFIKGVTGADASLTVDGIPVTSSSNSVSSAIAGVTLNLNSASPGTPVSVGVDADSSQAKAAIQSFVDGYNAVVTAINAQSNTGVGSSAVLGADSSLRELQQRILTDIGQSITGNSGFVNLESIGVRLQNDGTLKVDSAALDSALSSNFVAVQNLFQSAAGLADTFHTDLASLTDSTQGLLAVTIKGNTDTLTSLTNSINDMKERITDRQTSLLAEYNKINVTLQQLPLLQQQVAAQLSSIP